MFSESNLNFGLRLKTMRSLILLEDWLDENSIGEWSLVLLNMDEVMEQKEIEVRFQIEADKSAFVDFLKGRKGAPSLSEKTISSSQLTA